MGRKIVVYSKLPRHSLADYRVEHIVTSRLLSAYDEIELLSFPASCSSFDLLRTWFGDM